MEREVERTVGDGAREFAMSDEQNGPRIGVASGITVVWCPDDRVLGIPLYGVGAQFLRQDFTQSFLPPSLDDPDQAPVFPNGLTVALRAPEFSRNWDEPPIEMTVINHRLIAEDGRALVARTSNGATRGSATTASLQWVPE